MLDGAPGTRCECHGPLEFLAAGGTARLLQGVPNDSSGAISWSYSSVPAHVPSAHLLATVNNPPEVALHNDVIWIPLLVPHSPETPSRSPRAPATTRRAACLPMVPKPETERVLR